MNVYDPGAASDDRRVDYQEKLRTIGRWIDELQQDVFTVMETPDGFTVLVGLQTSDLQQIQLSHEGLEEQAKRMMKKRSGLPRRRHFSISGASGYGDFLRAVGYELNDAEAYDIVMCRVGDRLILTYSYLDPAKGYAWRKRRIEIDPAGAEQVMQTAFGRRHHGRKSFLSQFRH